LKKLFAFSAAIAALGFVSSAFAADMPVKASLKAPVIAPAAYNWTGLYLGIEGGGGWGNTQHTNNTNGINSGTTTVSGGLVGGTYGYNYQMGSWVLGLEGDFSWSGISANFNDNGSGFCTGIVQCQTKLRWLGTDRVRVGFAWDRLLVFGTAGIAYGDVYGTLTNAGFTTGSITHAGFIGGGGVEWAFAPAWSVKGEYLWTNLGDKATYGLPALPLVENVSLKNLSIVRVGLNYHFH
jgi:outer membrane immunogenic protein